MRKTVVTLAFLFVGAVLWAQTSLRDGMAVLEKKYGIHFVYDASLPLERRLGQPNGTTLEEALAHLFEGSDIRYEIKGKHVILKKNRKVTISGLILDAASGETLIGAGVTSGKDGAVTNNFGFYSLSIPGKDDKVSVTYSYVGYTHFDPGAERYDHQCEVKPRCIIGRGHRNRPAGIRCRGHQNERHRSSGRRHQERSSSLW